MIDQALIQNFELALGFPRAAGYFYKSIICSSTLDSEMFNQLIDDLPSTIINDGIQKVSYDSRIHMMISFVYFAVKLVHLEDIDEK